MAERLRAAIAAKGQACVVLSGGRSPVPFLEKLASENLDWAKVTVSLADERWVPVEHADSNPASPNLEAGLDLANPRRCLPLLAPSVPRQRLSMTRSLLASSAFTALSVQGQGKLATLRAALAGTDLTEMPIRAFLHDPLDIYWCP
ncbi:6-phosphogluconolactonase [compost metagenome]